jgi:hypothetical protein
MTYILLPATSPGDPTFGEAPERMPHGEAAFRVRFDREVWYNPEIRRAALAQILDAAPPRPWALVGFSKSGLGAISLAIEHPLFAAVIVFDAPVAMTGLPPWNTSAFYDQAGWERDLPINRLGAIREMLGRTRFRHVGGASFSVQHARLDAELAVSPAGSYEHVSEPGMAHHWASGWVARYADLLG